MTEEKKKERKEELTSEQKFEKMRQEIFAAANNLLQFGTLVKEINPTYSQYAKSDYRTYIQNPKRNEKEIRNMSQFLSRVSMPYKRILWYFASIYSFNWYLMPEINQIKPPDETKLVKQYSEMCATIDSLDMPVEMVNAIYFALRDGVFYGFLYEDDNSIFIHRLNPDYCKPVQLEAGVFNYAFDFSYFKKYKDALETWDPIFQAGYNAYEKDSINARWQILDPERTICIKADPDLDENLPFFVGIFEALLDLIDARTLQRNKEIIQNYKLIVQHVPLFDEDTSKNLDDFKLRMKTIEKFNAQISECVPEAVGIATTPMEIDTIDFKTDDNSIDLISSSMKQVFDDSGVSQLIMNSNTTGSTGVDSSIKVDVALSWNLVKNIERWVKRFIDYRKGNINWFFEILDVNIFNKDKIVERELKLANSGVPNKMRLAASAGITPMQVMSNQIFENEILKVHENWIPLQTSYTMSGTGRPANPEEDPTNDSTAKTRDSGETERTE